MNQILALREKCANLWNQTKAFLDSHRSEDGMVSAEDNATYEKMEADVVALGKEIERLERQAAIDREMDQPTAAPLVSRPTTASTQKQGRASDEYRNAFWGMIRNRAANPSIINALQIGTDSEGGYLVPDEYERTLVQGLEEENVLRVEQDYEKAAEYYAKGVEAGDLTSGYYLGLLFKQGLGVEQDYAKAAELFASVEASENKSATGVVAAGYELGALYEQGLGVEQDLNKAMELYEEAASYENQDAIDALARLSK